MRILVINKHPSAALNATIDLPALKRGEKVKVFSYGIAAGRGGAHRRRFRRRPADGRSTLQGSSLTFSPGPYSVHVIQLAKRERGKNDKSDDFWGDDEE